MPVILFDTLEQIPAELHDFTKTNEAGKIEINLVPKVKIDEFRENNTKLAKDKETLSEQLAKLSKFTGDDVDAFTAELEDLRKTKQLVNDGKLSKSDEIEKVLTDRTQKMRESHEEENRKAKVEYFNLEKQYNEVVEHLKNNKVESFVQAAINDPKSGARLEASPHILIEAKKIFKVEGDSILPKDAAGSTVYGNDGTNPMTPIEWLKGLQKTMPYLFKESAGGGANGSQSSGYGNLTKDEFNKLPASKRLEIANSIKK